MREAVFNRAAALRRLAVVAAVASVLSASPATTRAETIDFTELPPNTSADGVTVKGVTFGFTLDGVHSRDARFTLVGPGVTTISTAPNLEANALGVLSLSFATPVRDLAFSFLANTQSSSPNGFTLTLFDTNGGISTKDVATANLGLYSGARFADATSRSFVGAVIDPNSSASPPPRFIIDNLTFTPVPEPGALLALPAGAVVLLQRRRRV
jgi:hypothetical protein